MLVVDSSISPHKTPKTPVVERPYPPFAPPVGAIHYDDWDDPIRAEVKINSPCHWNNVRCTGCTRKVVP